MPSVYWYAVVRSCASAVLYTLRLKSFECCCTSGLVKSMAGSSPVGVVNCVDMDVDVVSVHSDIPCLDLEEEVISDDEADVCPVTAMHIRLSERVTRLAKSDLYDLLVLGVPAILLPLLAMISVTTEVLA